MVVVMPELHSGHLLDRPRSAGLWQPTIDPDSFAHFSERIARFLGTGRYLVIQTIIVAIWMGLNVTAVAWRFDPYPFILLNLVFSAQAAYAAPLILLVQYRQADRDRISLGEDRNRAERTQADTDFLARELAALRIAIGEAITRNYLRGELQRARHLLPAAPGTQPGQNNQHRPSWP
jgi:uncharacterized membrane protein